ncbi:hypothetical protein KI659_16705 [Litoribacter alkaliphilus]|uniref:Uncharacterized protein n=1 Tax=Litoribacter ruber TaxID=702568 RepID=A0AAP2CJ24_9BACT|nr:hypothetical protein [Litoribacter alkaliphilus]MBS9525661.1 hypothetical protein [Litoribacter alkaliphilus]
MGAYSFLIYLPLTFLSIGSLALFIMLIVIGIKEAKVPDAKLFSILFIAGGMFLGVYDFRNGLFWNKTLEAAFIDERSRINLMLFENGNYIIFANWFFGEERFEGKYEIKEDTLVFKKSPVTDNDFISTESIIDYNAGKIYFKKGKDEKYDTTCYYFQIDF